MGDTEARRRGASRNGNRSSEATSDHGDRTELDLPRAGEEVDELRFLLHESGGLVQDDDEMLRTPPNTLFEDIEHFRKAVPAVGRETLTLRRRSSITVRSLARRQQFTYGARTGRSPAGRPARGRFRAAVRGRSCRSPPPR